MKKLILGFLLIFGISSTLFAEVDCIALATNGEFNEQSAGVKVLNDEEMQEVKGGLIYLGNNVMTPTLVSKYYIVQNTDLPSNLIQEAVGLLYYNETLVYAKRYYRSQIEYTWLIGYNPQTGYMRDLSLMGASSRTLKHLNSKYRY